MLVTASRLLKHSRVSLHGRHSKHVILFKSEHVVMSLGIDNEECFQKTLISCRLLVLADIKANTLRTRKSVGEGA